MECTSPLTLSGIELPCGQCTMCRINRSKEWQVRLLGELDFWTDSTFLTLTYDDETLPPDYSLKPEHATLFMKRFRKQTGVKVKYYMVGEYGEELQRPHYHYIMFGIPPTWEGFVRVYPRSNSEKLKNIVRVNAWTLGYAHVGTVNETSIRYVTEYVTNKFTGPLAEKVYGQRELPFQRCSRGLGEQFVKKHRDQLMQDGSTQYQNVRLPLPRYYRKKLDLKNYTIARVLEERALLKSTLSRATYIHRSGTLDPEILKQEVENTRLQVSKNLNAKKSLKPREA